MKRAVFALVTATLAAAFGLPPSSAAARAPDDFEESYAKPTVIASPEYFQLELKVGPYSADMAGRYDDFFKKPAWMVGVELDANVVRIPYFGTVGVGAGWGWGRSKGRTLLASGNRSDEAARLILFPLSALAVVRMDVLMRELNFPLMLSGKIGADFVRWKSETGAVTEGSGLSMGLRWAVQAALDLNFIERSAARNLDEEWGINRTYLLFEFYGSTAEGDSLPVGDKTFSVGLGFMF